MSNIRSLTSPELLNRTRQLAQREREITLEVLHHLREVHARRLWAELHYGSLTEFAIHELGYSGPSAHRRVEAMHLLTALPEVEVKIQSGELNLTNVTQVQGYLKHKKKSDPKAEPPTKEENLKLLEQVAGKSTREVDKILLSLSPSFKPQAQKDRIKDISDEYVEIKFRGDRELEKLLEQMKNVCSHVNDQNPDYNSLIKRAIKFYLHKGKKVPVVAKTEEASEVLCSQSVRAKSGLAKLEAVALKTDRPLLAKSPAPGDAQGNLRASTSVTLIHSRYIRMTDRRELHSRSRGQCEFKSEQGIRCTSKRALQIEHMYPHAKGGANTLENLQLLCPAHNQLRAIQAFGSKHVMGFV